MKARIIVDTSIWITFFRYPLSQEKKEIDLLIDNDQAYLVGIVLSELLQGTKSKKELCLLRSKIDVLPFLETTYGIWSKAGIISYSLKRKGITIPLSDCLIAAIAVKNNCQIYSLDPHFQHLPVKLYKTHKFKKDLGS